MTDTRIDDVLGDSSKVTTTLPTLITMEGVHPELERFMNSLCIALTSKNLNLLLGLCYIDPDRRDAFTNYLISTDFWQNIIKWYDSYDKHTHLLEVFLNVDRYKNAPSQVVQGLIVQIHRVYESSTQYDQVNSSKMHYVKSSSEVLFRYVSGQFRLLPVFPAFLTQENKA